MEQDFLRLRQRDLFWRETDGAVVILDGKSWEYLNLNAAGRVLWERLKDGASEPDLAAALRETYGIDADTAAADAKGFVQKLADRDLLES